MSHPRHLWSWWKPRSDPPPVGKLVAAVLVLLAGTWFLFGDGGAHPGQVGSASSYQPAVIDWELARTDEPKILCSDQAPCRLDRLEDVDGECTWRGRIWMPENDDISPVLRDMRWLTEVQVFHNRTPRMSWIRPDQPPNGTTWMRPVGLHVDLTLEVPCDTYGLWINLNYDGTTLWGDELAEGEGFFRSTRATVWLDPGRAGCTTITPESEQC